MNFLRRVLLWFVSVWVALGLYDSVMPPISTLMMARAVTLQPILRHWVPLRAISPTLQRAVIAAEDGKFCSHHGIDWQALHHAIDDMRDEDGDPSHGASTITMQTTKNLFLWNGHSYLRKAIEIPFALMLDLLWSKQHILESYLNIAEFGPGIFGADAASRYYFHKPASKLTSHEAALFAAALPNPKKRNPASPSPYVVNYAASIEARSWQQNTSCLH